MLPSDKPTLDERYSSAIDAKDLSMAADERRPIDLLVAAGWCRADALGTLLYRLLREFDRLRSDAHRVDKAAADARAALLQRAREERKSKGDSHEARRALAAHFAAVEDASLTDRLLVMMRLRSLAEARAALGRHADVLAAQRGLGDLVEVVPGIAGRALEHWLDPLCPICDGRGFFGGYRTPQIGCTGCNGTRLRRARLHDTTVGHEFGRLLLLEMDRKTAAVHDLMLRYLDRWGEAAPSSERLTTIMLQARKRLGDLNSSGAQED